MDYPKSVPSAGLVNGRFVDENPLTGSPGSLIPADWGNGVTQEILNVIKAAGLVPDERKTDQLTQAIGELLDFKRLKNTPTTLGGYGISDASGRLLAVKQFETVGITLYRPDPRAKRIRVRLVGAGGSGGGCQPVPAGSFTVGGGGGSGAYAEGLFDVNPQMLSGVPITLGAGGEARAVAGTTGGSSSFGSHMSATGGQGGQVLTLVSSTINFVHGGMGGSSVTGGNLASARGTQGGYAMSNPNWGTAAGFGGASPFDGGAPLTGLNTPGFAGSRGSGGGGSCSSNTTAACLSGAGGNGFCEIWEYA
ncbi:hypothetical protein QL104_06245 [Pseudomonas piscis]|uniref:Glycine-rich domain-containing protein n=1 Tax=Pseudomonas piscis TaxID=2614538 RepID=A0ABY9NNJ3_9PSED|nr:hypothetical protein [Pseudomonas piscis]WMN19007.1 hypothetical protein QL104_06245 [Pseudomonas piscis]